MKKIIVLFILVSFVLPVPVRAGSAAEPVRVDFNYPVVNQSFNPDNVKFAALETDFLPVERKLIEQQRLQEEMMKEAQKKPEPDKSSNWWKWALGILIVGGVAAAASGGGGGGGSSTSTGNTGSSTVTW